MRRISVVIPVYRNRETLADLHRRLVAALEARWDLEMIFVDDACPSGSDIVLGDLAARDQRVRVLTHGYNLGQQQSLLDGIAEATGDAVVLMDADLQDPPEAIPQLLEQLETGRWSAVFAGRRGMYQSPVRMLTSRLYKRAIAYLAGLPRDAGAFVAFSKSTRDRILAFDAPEPYSTVMIGAAGGEILSIPVERSPRSRGRSSYSGGMRLRAALSAIRLALRLNRQCSHTNSITSYSGTTTAVR